MKCRTGAIHKVSDHLVVGGGQNRLKARWRDWEGGVLKARKYAYAYVLYFIEDAFKIL